MKLDVALKGLLATQDRIRTSEGVSNPVLLSSLMMKLSAFTSAVEQHLAEYERDYEQLNAKILKRCMIDEQMNASQSEKQVKIETAELKSQIVYLGRLVSSAWKVVGTAQSRVSHLIKEATTQI